MNITLAHLERVYRGVVDFLNGDCQCTCDDCVEFLRIIEEVREELEVIENG